MIFNNRIKFITLLLSLFITNLTAQTIDPKFNPADSTQFHYLITKNDSRLFGQVVSLINTEVKFKFLTDTIIYPLSEISVIKVLSTQSEASKLSAIQEKVTSVEVRIRMQGEARVASHRNFISETAFGLPQGASEYRNAMGLYNSFDAGVGNGISVGAQVLVPGIIGVRAKYTKSLNDYLHYGAGTSFYYGILDGNFVNHSFGLLTLGTPDYHLTFTGGYGWSLNQEEFENNSRTPVFSAAGSLRFAQNWRWMFEFGSTQLNGFSDFERFFSSTVSWFKYRSSLDFGVAGVSSSSGRTRALPVIAFGYRFGN